MTQIIKDQFRFLQFFQRLSNVICCKVSSCIFTRKQQSGFRPNHSTETALIKVTDNLLFNMDKDNTSGLVFLDFKKAFDLVNHKVLLDKIGLYGGTVETVNWFESYLSDRRQCVKVNGLKSSLMPVKQGVPQGSIVGPILFVLLINDLPLHVINSDVDIYADDSTLTFSSRWYANISFMEKNINEDLDQVLKWSKMGKELVKFDFEHAQCQRGPKYGLFFHCACSYSLL